MSEEGKKAAIAKLDNMEFSILRPDTLIDSSYLEVDKDSNYLDAYATLKVNSKKHSGEFVGKERVKGDWRYDLFTDAITTEDNCYYYGALNQFFILDAFINDNTYRLDMTREEKMGTLGEVIGHELTHGFDPNGIQYDKDGNMVVTDDNPYGWMPEEDYNAFMDRANKLSEYFSEFTPYPYNRCDGSLYWGEAAADIAGMSIGLKIASKYDDFDYDTYFRSHAALWVVQTTLIVEQGDIFNEHPLYYLRINATCQQFDEFFETYDIKEGDLMYLAPEDRISIW
jgi:putative endopeptidase